MNTATATKSLPIASAFEISSPIAGVSSADWSTFVRTMTVAPIAAVSRSNAVGMFEMKPERMAELGVLERLQRARGSSGRMIKIGAWVDPMYGRRLMRSVKEQYALFERSMVDYAGKIACGEVRSPEGLSLSGALALLHKPGPRGKLVSLANGIF